MGLFTKGYLVCAEASQNVGTDRKSLSETTHHLPNKKRVAGKVTKAKEQRLSNLLVWDSKHQEKLSKGHTLTKNVHSLETLASGRILTGIVQSMKMKRTIIIRRDYLHFIKKSQRYERRHKNLVAHMSPCFRDVQH